MTGKRRLFQILPNTLHLSSWKALVRSTQQCPNLDPQHIPSLRKVFIKRGSPNNSKHLEAIPPAEQDSKKLDIGVIVIGAHPLPPDLGDCFNPMSMLG